MKKSDIFFWVLCLAVVVWFAGQRIQRSRAAKAWEAERQERIAKDFNKSYDEVKAYVAQYIPEVTDSMMEAWSASNRLENMEIGGERRYFRKAGPNLFRIDKACEGIKAAAETLSGQPLDGHEADDAAVIPLLVAQVKAQLAGGARADAAAELPADEATAADSGADASAGLPADEAAPENPAAEPAAPAPYLGTPKTYRVRYTLTVDADAVPAGETVRCWLPFPRSDVARQTGVQLLSTSEPNPVMSRPDDAHCTVYMEKAAVAGEPTEFSEEFTYTAWGEWHPLSAEAVKPYVNNSRMYLDYTAERPPHICFSPQIRALVKTLAGDETNPYLLARKYFTYVNDNFPWASAREYSTLEDIPAYVLQEGHGDCGMVTLLFITLCRCSGIPARWQSGFMMHPSGWNLHDWGEVYFEGAGWVPADESFGIPPYAVRTEPLLGEWAPMYEGALAGGSVAGGSVASGDPAAGDGRILPLPEAEFFYLGGIDPYRMVVNSDYSAPLYPRKKFPRSETVDFQRGEVEWAGGNLYFDQWDYHMDITYIDGYFPKR